jgi:tetratricopeptide (TPR) repeat protein
MWHSIHGIDRHRIYYLRPAYGRDRVPDAAIGAAHRWAPSHRSAGLIGVEGTRVQSNPLVSILIRSMDRPTLERALAAAAAQTYRPLEIVVVAACGPEHRPLEAARGDVPVRLVVPPERLRRSDAANACTANAHGDWMIFLDDDDAMAPTHIQTLVAAALAPPPVMVAHTRATMLDEAGREIGIFGGPRVPWLQFECGFFQPGAALFARALVERGVRFDPAFDILEDMDFWIQCARHTDFRFVDQATSHYYAESGTSGAGFGANADSARTASALARLRRKWAPEVERTERSFEFLVHRGRDFLSHRQFRAALDFLRRAVASRPRSVDALNMLGVAFLCIGDPAQAIEVLTHALSIAPGESQVMANLDLARRSYQTH